MGNVGYGMCNMSWVGSQFLQGKTAEEESYIYSTGKFRIFLLLGAKNYQNFVFKVTNKIAKPNVDFFR